MNDKEYFITRGDGRQEGPYTEEQLVSRINAGKYPPDTQVWTEGMDEWAELFSVFPVPATQEPQTTHANGKLSLTALISKFRMKWKVVMTATIAVLLIGTGALVTLIPSDTEANTSGQAVKKKKMKRKNSKRDVAATTNTGIPKRDNPIQRAHDELQQKGISPRQYTSALMSAIRENDTGKVRLLVTAGVDVNMPEEGIQPLVLAASCGNPEIVKILLNTPGIDINRTNDDNSSAIYTAAQGGHVECLKLLVSIPEADTNLATNEGITPLLMATYNGHPECIRILLSSQKTDVNLSCASDQNETPLFMAALFNRPECVEALLTSPSIDVNKEAEKGSTPLFAAAQKGHTECLRLLLTARNIDVNKPNNNRVTPLANAIAFQQLECVRLLTQHPNIDINKYSYEFGYHPLYISARVGNAACMQCILAHPEIDINRQTYEGQTALLVAVANNHLECVQLLVNAPGIDANCSEPEMGLTPLHAAVIENFPRCIQLLLQAPNIDVYKKVRGYTPLETAIGLGRSECARLLRAARRR